MVVQSHYSPDRDYFGKKCPTNWLSGSGGIGETRLNDCAFAGKPRLQRSGIAAACPISFGVHCSRWADLARRFRI